MRRYARSVKGGRVMRVVMTACWCLLVMRQHLRGREVVGLRGLEGDRGLVGVGGLRLDDRVRGSGLCDGGGSGGCGWCWTSGGRGDCGGGGR